MSIIKALLFPNVVFEDNREDQNSPVGMWSMKIEISGHIFCVSLRDVQTYHYPSVPFAENIKVTSYKFRGYELCAWKPQKRVADA